MSRRVDFTSFRRFGVVGPDSEPPCTEEHNNATDTDRRHSVEKDLTGQQRCESHLQSSPLPVSCDALLACASADDAADSFLSDGDLQGECLQQEMKIELDNIQDGGLKL